MRSRLYVPSGAALAALQPSGAALAALAALLVGVTPGFSAAQERNDRVLGYVLSVRGEWIVGGRASVVSSGRAVLAGDTIRAGRPPWRGYEIVVVQRDGAALRYRCADAPAAKPLPEAWNCARPIALSTRTGAPLHGRILDAVMHHVGEHPARPASLVSRSILDPDLREAVVVLGDSGLLMGDALATLPADEYGFTLTPIRVDNSVVDRVGEPITARLAWDPNAPRALRTPALQPGLYELRMVGASDVAWVLICAGTGCDAIRAEFREVRDLAGRWGGQVPAPDMRAFVRAALDLLSRPRTGP